jgi:hypothetical protein
VPCVFKHIQQNDSGENCNCKPLDLSAVSSRAVPPVRSPVRFRRHWGTRVRANQAQRLRERVRASFIVDTMTEAVPAAYR